ncbi:hypothetical protein Syun_027659 [Stephania yunnanensis]|uniref:Uncharacterized protein n=1 Tax=Stephania yunnanensis TaxID=152371 RepID=A0AAP0ELH4_9MAGN
MNLRRMLTMKKMSSHRHQTVIPLYMARGRGCGNPEDKDVEEINRHPEGTSTTGRGSLSHHAIHALSDGRYSLHYTHGWSHVTLPYPTYAPGPSSSHYTSSSPPSHPYPYQHGAPSPPVHALPAQHGIIPSSSHHSTLLTPADGHPHDHGIRPSSSHHATPSPSTHLAHFPGVSDEHTSTSSIPPTPHRHSSARSSSNRLRSSIPRAIEEIPEFFRPLTAPVFFTRDLQMSFAIYDAWCRKASIRYTGNIYLIAKKIISPIYLTDEVFEHYKRMRATDEAFKKKFEQMSMNRKSEVGGSGKGISLHSAGSISTRQHGDTLAELTQRLEEMSTQTPDTSIDEDVIYLELVPEVRGRVYRFGSRGYHRSISLGEASSSRRPAYGPHKLEELQRDHQRLRETLLKG